MRVVEPEGGVRSVVWSASDLKQAAECEFAWARALDAKLGRVPAVEEPEDVTLERAARMGDAYELRVLDDYLADFGAGVVTLPKVSAGDAEAMREVLAETEAALRSDATVIYQAAFSTDEFVGFADFLLRDEQGWRVQDSKLARKARVTALMQLAAYADQLDRLGIERSDEVDLILGDGTISTHRVDDLLPLFHVRRARLRAMIADRRVAEGAEGEPLAWGDDRGDLQIRACGRCATCNEQVEQHRDLLLVARMRPAQRARLRAAGIETIDQLAVADAAPEGMHVETFRALRDQARLQAGVTPEQTAPPFELISAQAISLMPRPSQGDIFFDFEGDPLYTESGDEEHWGIDYLFGWIDNAEQYTALWAHTFAEERQALLDFLEFVKLRRASHPDMHIYHYAPYETAHLAAMAARHGVGEADVDRLLREGVFVDLYPLVLRTVRVGSRSYSIKKLEPLYMGAEVREADVQKGDESIIRYVEARELAGAGEIAASRAILDDLAEYNRYDCVSTRRLRDWMIGLARESGVLPAPPDDAELKPYEPSPLSLALLAAAQHATHEGRDGQVYRVAAAALDYYPREAKTFWVSHYQRLREPLSMWDQTRDVLRIEPSESVVREHWGVEEGRRASTRVVELRGELAPGSTIGIGARPFALYETPAPFDSAAPSRVIHVPHEVEVIEILEGGFLVREFAIRGQTWDAVPIALAPSSPPPAAAQQSAIEEWADRLLRMAPELPTDAATDILRGIAPRTRSDKPLPPAGDDTIEAIVRGIRDLDSSYLAVQGPPGTGKTYTGSRVIARLVNDFGFRVGVVAQSHAIVETVLDRVIEAGVPAQQVAKAPKDATAEHAFTVIRKNGMAGFIAEQSGKGLVVGGTAWDFSNTTRVERRGLDLLVIDEAGQFSLASTIAVAAGARRVLLLGDPQQLPQVSQGTHPEPVDTSALGWVMHDDPVIRPSHGYFLARSWRMHPAVAAPVSTLSYAGQLASAPGAEKRSVEGIEPGLYPVPVRHRGNATQSPEEAAQVVAIVRDLVGRAFTDTSEADAPVERPLAASDIIVVAPYNAQKQLIIDELRAAGFPDVAVGTVDNFQGKEAVVSITSLAASSGRDAPRGSEFLLLQNRLNVAISRAKFAAYLVYSPGLLDDLPFAAEGVARLSAFARLVGVEAEDGVRA
ncbi:TM0106 family RecB-like putative nuclease [Microbacterium keratanolyticum]|uniref:TM0106 family RecB-like putative nuclease n=1 Tax=Microbacterium keratanolyticum TaxID=67574 RepID=UPI003639F5E7